MGFSNIWLKQGVPHYYLSDLNERSNWQWGAVERQEYQRKAGFMTVTVK